MLWVALQQMNLYGKKISMEVKQMGMLEQTRQMKLVMGTMRKETERLEKKFEIFIANQNDLAKMLATDYELLKVIAIKNGVKEEDFPKPLISMEIEEETKEV